MKEIICWRIGLQCYENHEFVNKSLKAYAYLAKLTVGTLDDGWRKNSHGKNFSN